MFQLVSFIHDSPHEFNPFQLHSAEVWLNTFSNVILVALTNTFRTDMVAGLSSAALERRYENRSTVRW